MNITSWTLPGRITIVQRITVTIRQCAITVKNVGVWKIKSTLTSKNTTSSFLKQFRIRMEHVTAINAPNAVAIRIITSGNH